MFRSVAGLLFAVTGLFHASSAEGARYQIIDLGATVNQFSVRAINDLNQVVGYDNYPTKVSKLWLPESAYNLPAGWNTLASLPGRAMYASCINNSGQIAAGYYGSPSGSAIWLPSPAFGLPAGWNIITTDDGNGASINSRGEVVGHNHSFESAFIWLPTASYGLPAGKTSFFPGMSYQFGRDINDSGQFTGISAENVSRPLLWLPSPAFGLPAGMNLLAPMSGDTGTYAVSINSSSQVVGYSDRPGGNITRTRAFAWLPQPAHGLPAGYLDLGGYDDNAAYYNVTATAINDSMQIVGSNSRGGYDVNAFIWEPGTGMQDLNALVDPGSGWTLQYAMDINRLGSIVGIGQVNGVEHAYLLVVPEPTSAAVSLAFASTFAFRHSRRTRIEVISH